MTATPKKHVAIDLIGRNEGDRLVRALAAAAPQADLMIYVDSGSTDGSVENAKDAGAEIVELDLSIPFTAARARNAGFARAREIGDFDYVQFIDGDCALVDGWIAVGTSRISQNQDLGIVTGWRSEKFPERTVYNQQCDIEWRGPVGPIEACGGDMLVRVEAFEAVSGFDPRIIAAEDDEFCIRVGKAGWRIERLAHEMTTHDADIRSFDQWWRRGVRAGHGFGQVGDLHAGYFSAPRRRIVIYGVVLPVLIVIGLFLSISLLFTVFVLYTLSWIKVYLAQRADPRAKGRAMSLATLLTLSKFPAAQGWAIYLRRKWFSRDFEIIEYQ